MSFMWATSSLLNHTTKNKNKQKKHAMVTLCWTSIKLRKRLDRYSANFTGKNKQAWSCFKWHSYQSAETMGDTKSLWLLLPLSELWGNVTQVLYFPTLSVLIRRLGQKNSKGFDSKISLWEIRNSCQKNKEVLADIFIFVLNYYNCVIYPTELCGESWWTYSLTFLPIFLSLPPLH